MLAYASLGYFSGNTGSIELKYMWAPGRDVLVTAFEKVQEGRSQRLHHCRTLETLKIMCTVSMQKVRKRSTFPRVFRSQDSVLPPREHFPAMPFLRELFRESGAQTK